MKHPSGTFLEFCFSACPVPDGVWHGERFSPRLWQSRIDIRTCEYRDVILMLGYLIKNVPRTGFRFSTVVLQYGRLAARRRAPLGSLTCAASSSRLVRSTSLFAQLNDLVIHWPDTSGSTVRGAR